MTWAARIDDALQRLTRAQDASAARITGRRARDVITTCASQLSTTYASSSACSHELMHV